MEGYKTIDVCNHKAAKLTAEYNSLCGQKAELKRQIEEIEKKIVALRKEEVYNVCDYVRTYTRMGVLEANDIDTYLCHCQNMLNGNIDGTFLTFDKEK